MQEGRQITRIPLERGASLPRREAPAGYVIVIEDVEYGNRFKIARLQEVNREQVRRAADVPFETKLRLIIEAPNAGVVAQDLHDRFVAPGESGEWFDLDDAQVAQPDEIGRPQEMSLRDLALNAAGGDSLVQDAKIVETRAESPFVHMQRREQRPARRATAWILLTVIVIGGILVAENAPLIRREISRLFATQSQPSVEIRSVPATISSSVAGDTRPNLGPAQSPTAVPEKTRGILRHSASASAHLCQHALQHSRGFGYRDPNRSAKLSYRASSRGRQSLDQVLARGRAALLKPKQLVLDRADRRSDRGADYIARIIADSDCDID